MTFYREGVPSGDMPESSQPSQKPTTSPTGPRQPIFNQIPVGVAVIIVLLLAAHLAVSIIGQDGNPALLGSFAVSPMNLSRALEAGSWVTVLKMVIGYQFIHGGTVHFVMNLAMLLQAGPIAEAGLRRNSHTTLRFVLFYLLCGVGGAVVYCFINAGSQAVTIGASGAISGVFAGFLWGAIGLARPGQAMLKPVLASAVVFLLINVGLAALARGFNFVPIAWETHLGGFLTGLILYPIFARLGNERTTTS